MLGENIKKLRNKHSLSQVEFAKMLSVSSSTVAMWETNRRDPDTEMLAKIAKIFNVSTDYLLGINTKKEEKHQIAFFNGIESLSEKDKELVQNLIDSLKNKNK